MPFRLDVGRSCSGGCKYCYVRSRAGNYYHENQFTNPALVNKFLNSAMDNRIKAENAILECLRNRVPLHFGGMSDPFLIPDSYQHITIEILRALDKQKYPTLISTKTDIRRNKDALKLILGKQHFALQISFSTFNDNIAGVIEPNAPKPSERLEGARLALASGNWLSCRLQPFFPGQDVDAIVYKSRNYGFKHITVEHFKLPFDKKIDVNTLSGLFKINISELFSKNRRIKRGREWEMPFEVRLDNIRAFLEAGQKYHIPIGIGDNGLQHFSSTNCCCGIDHLPGFENWLKHNSLVAVQRAESKGQITYNSIAYEWAPRSDISRMINSKTRLKTYKNTIKNHIKMHWIQNRQFSPRMFYGVIAERNQKGFVYSLDHRLKGGYCGKQLQG